MSVAVRPEKLVLSWSDPGAAINSIRGRVGAQAYFGDRSHFYVETEGLARPVAVANQKRDRALGGADSIGKPVWITFPAEAAVVLTR